MEFIIGGAYQGKLAYAYEEYHLEGKCVLDGTTCEFSELSLADAIYNFDRVIERFLKEGMDAFKEVEDLLYKNPKVIIISNEIGYGIVPMEKETRYIREQTGRISCYLAKCANRVVRVVCGIATVIKK